MARAERDPVTMAESLDRWRRQLGLAAPSTMGSISSMWAEVLGNLAAEVEPRALVDGTLRVAVIDPAVAEAVRWRASAIVADLNGRLGGALVERVDVRVQR
jgi:hypothetical protein